MNNGYAIALNEWIFDTRIKNELPLLLYISSLTAKNGFAYAGNEHLAEKFETTTITISRKIKKLESIGYLNISYKRRGCEVIGRELRLTRMLTDDYQKKQPTINKNVKDNITSLNTTSSSSQQSNSQIDYKAIMQSWNESGFSEIRIISDTRQKAIKARYKELITVREDLKDIEPHEAFARFFTYLADSKWLSGQVKGANGKEFNLTFDWILSAKNFIKAVEGNYHD